MNSIPFQILLYQELQYRNSFIRSNAYFRDANRQYKIAKFFSYIDKNVLNNFCKISIDLVQFDIHNQLKTKFMSQQITASRMNLQVFKQKIAAARKGHQLLKRKADALKKKFKEVMKDLLQSKKKMGQECKEAFFLIAEATYAAGQFQGKVVQAVKRASIKLDKSEQNIAGVLIPNLSVRQFQDADNSMSQIGLQRGGYSIQKCREKFRSILSLLVSIASLQASFLTLDQKIKVTNRRVNALEHVVIPRFINIYRYIEQQLDQQARQDFFRLKKVLDNKKKHMEEQQNVKNKEQGGHRQQGETSLNLLDDIDEDIIF